MNTTLWLENLKGIDICGSALRVWKDNIEMCLNGAWFQASAAKQIRTALSWVLTDVSGRPVGPILTTEGGTIVSPNVGKKLPPLAA
jgi:hypothetical protein